MALILVVDDEMPIAELLTELLEDCGHTALQAANGAEAFLLAQQHRPALIITDVMMPVMDGHGLLRAVRSTPELVDTAVVLASAATACGKTNVSAKDADGYMQKPFDLDTIEQMLDRFVPAHQFTH